MPDTRPDTQFVDGVCSACIAYDKRKDIDWDARKETLEELLDKHHGMCIVPSSGGKDSHYQALTLAEMGVDVTIVTATTCHLTDVGRRNIDNLARHFDTIEVTPNRTIRAKLNRLSLQMLGDISWPEHVLIHTVPFEVAMDMGINLVFYGENPLNQYGGPLDLQADSLMTRRWVSEFGGFLGMRPQDWIGVEGITEKDMRPYMSSMGEILPTLDVHFLGQFLPWHSRINAKVAQDNGFEVQLPTSANWWNFENLDNAQTGLHDYCMFLKYGYGRGCAQLSVDIRSGVYHRDDGAAWVDEHEGAFPYPYMGVSLEEVLDRIGLSRADMGNILGQYKCSSHAS
jgi:hypothetical protein